MSEGPAKPEGKSTGTIRVGISGWTYPPWRGVFYPKKLPQKRELEYASSKLSAIEINGTFYRLQKPSDFGRWREETPEDFVFSVKAPRFITHIRRLRDFEAPLANFLACGLLRLGPKLGPILWQFPPSMKFDRELFAAFLAALPQDGGQAVKTARSHDDWLKGREWLEAESRQPMRHAIEIRNESFRVPQFIDLLRANNVALVCADTVEWPRLMDVTSDFFYCRLHGSEELYASGYDVEALDTWASRVGAWARGDEPKDAERVGNPAHKVANGRNVFVFFDNDAKVRAPHDAMSLAQRLGVSPAQSASKPEQSDA